MYRYPIRFQGSIRIIYHPPPRSHCTTKDEISSQLEEAEVIDLDIQIDKSIQSLGHIPDIDELMNLAFIYHTISPSNIGL